MGFPYHNFGLTLGSPRQARHFCEGVGQQAKADWVDAAMLAKMRSLLQLKADQPKSETLHDLKQLARARQALIKGRTAAKIRLAATPHRLLFQQIKRRLSQIKRDLSQSAVIVDTIIAADTELCAKADIMVSPPSIAKMTASAISD
ncbi:IS110 family transposase [Pacificibacter marinus]|uniref:IS110 family transposase n=1 Tax=Pacificibacter marinus TaxID=658057 RepID=UPI002090CC08|nr:IS110 family transposase [Pacificibacter marinus]